MSVATGSAPGAVLGEVWPSRYLAEEVWLRSRRQVAVGLTDRGWLLPEPRVIAMGEDFHAAGKAAWERLLGALPPDERAFLGSELVAGPASGVIAERAPLVLAFGESLATTVSQLTTGRAPDPDVGFACAQINLLVSLFDLITDRRGGPAVDARSLDAVLESPDGCKMLKEQAATLPLGAPRVFGLLLADLFERLHRLARSAADGSQWAGFQRTVRSAYAAQARASWDPDGAGDARAVARDKSVLPFRILGEVIAFDVPPGEREAVLSLTEAFAEVFWRTDDLADVASDWTTGDANSVIAGCGSRAGDGAGDWLGLAHVLDAGIDEACAQLLAAIDGATEVMSRLARGDDELDQARAWLTWYVVDWLR